jgi:siroheme decarboxylase
MEIIADPIDRRLLDDWQRDFPITASPFAKMASALDLDEDEVLNRLQRMKAGGRITRVGATCAPNTVSASTLAAVAAPEERIEEVAAIIGAQDGVNHNYLREDEWNLWFVATGPDRSHVDTTLANIQRLTGLQVLDLPLVRPFNIDLGFRLSGKPSALPPRREADLEAIQPGDLVLLQSLTQGLAICSAPYAELANRLNRSEADVMERIRALHDAAIITRFGVIVRHRALGWSSNAMVVWELPANQVDVAGPKLAAQPGVTLCYERRTVPGIWSYRLFSMIHARSRNEARDVLAQAAALPELTGARYKVLFSTRCFKQTGAMISKEAAA